jgi:hypothetical protein
MELEDRLIKSIQSIDHKLKDIWCKMNRDLGICRTIVSILML